MTTGLRNGTWRRVRLAALLMLASTGAWPVAAADPPPFAMNEEVRTEVRAMRGIALAPDGRSVLAAITETTANGGLPHLWLLAPGAAPRQLTFRTGERGESEGRFLPDGSILFLATRDGARALYRLPTAGGEPDQFKLGKAGTALTARWNGAAMKDALPVSGYAVSPDGRTIALWAEDPETAEVKARRERKDDGYAHDIPDHRTHLYLVDTATGAARAVPVGGVFSTVDWSFDGADLVVATDPDSDETGPDARFWRIDPATLAVSPIDVPRTAKGVAFLPGRNRLVYTDQCADDAPPRCNDLIVKDLGNGQVKNLTRGFDGEIPGDYEILPDGDLLMAIGVHTRTRLARMSTRTGAVSWIETGQPVAFAPATNARQSGWAFLTAGPTQPTTAMLLPRLNAKPVALAAPALVPARWPKVPSHLISWQNEGLTIEGLLYLPTIAPGKKAPLVVSIHGGPAGRFQDGYDNLVQMLVAEGWAVFQPNIRGSTGYGAKFTAANKNDMGGADYRDVMTGVDAVLKSHPLDASRMALIGYSYGGEMAGFVVGKTDRFKAIVSGAPVINQFSEYGTEDGSFYDRWYYGKPWINFADAWRQSPLSTVATAKTPFLLLQGDKDVTDPLGQSLEMYRALKQTHVPVALVVYPREGHGETGGNFRAMVSQEPWHGVDLRRRMFGFLRAAFAGEPDPLAAARKDVP
ncbi:alpha/beta hydrolase family protein [Sphingomonas alpina]|uniref:S9 family peptidase n=1 Tax=Sphingomonas alpina TaxID=653931 RepID=A0A7H0LFC3_9SPHN|nr:prolyl oligopeptidase family serine peptidase [Sphingomonas alpina]QNQ08376.1 S9 family peptidase [Sphingomonas alpina]